MTNKNGTITHSYINGPSGRIGVYWNNNDTLLYYFLTDHLGSTRVMVDNVGRVKEYINYDPFGEVLESWASYSEPLTFTGKQRDQHSTFDFYYFGSRYYDYRIGQFASVDKAGQFAGGYLYGGNNPLVGVDPDGNFFGIPFLLADLAIKAAIAVAPAAAVGAATSAVTYSAFNLDKGWTWKGMLQSAGVGAAGGTIGAAAGGIGNVTSKVLGGNARLSSLRGVFGTAVGSGIANMAIATAQGAEPGDLWKFGVSGFATGAMGASGGFGLAKHGMAGRLAYQAATTYVRSVGDNWAAGMAKPSSNVMIGIGPVNLRIGEGEKLINYRDNARALIGNTIGILSVISPIGKENSISWDWNSLSFNYKGGFMRALLGQSYAAMAYHAIYDADLADLAHEGSHIWQQRAMGSLFDVSYQYNHASARLRGEKNYYGNYYEWLAEFDPF